MLKMHNILLNVQKKRSTSKVSLKKILAKPVKFSKLNRFS